jgi:hypothetical protein
MFTQLAKKFPASDGTRSFITVFTRAHHWSLSWLTWIQFTAFYPISPWFVMTSFHLRLGLPSGLFPSDFRTRIFALQISPIRAICPAHLILLDLFILIMFDEAYKFWISSLCSLLQPSPPDLLGPNILFSTLFPNTGNYFATCCFFRWDVISPLPNPHLEDHPLSPNRDC